VKFTVIIALSAFLVCVFGCILAMASFSMMSSKWDWDDAEASRWLDGFALRLLVIGAFYCLGWLSSRLRKNGCSGLSL